MSVLNQVSQKLHKDIQNYFCKANFFQIKSSSNTIVFDTNLCQVSGIKKIWKQRSSRSLQSFLLYRLKNIWFWVQLHAETALAPIICSLYELLCPVLLPASRSCIWLLYSSLLDGKIVQVVWVLTFPFCSIPTGLQVSIVSTKMRQPAYISKQKTSYDS